MTLIKSISGIRGTIGDPAGQGLTPIDIVESIAGYGQWIKSHSPAQRPVVVIGRDGRISGPMVHGLATHTLNMMGIDVLDADLSTTPTIEMAVGWMKADGGIIITASHNPAHWNALKFLNNKGEFISAEDGQSILNTIAQGNIDFASIEHLGTTRPLADLYPRHVEDILAMPFVHAGEVKDKGYRVVVDCINSTGALALPPLLEALGCDYVLINDEVNGRFAHTPEPLTKHLTQLSDRVQKEGADLGIAVDPDVDRLVFMDEEGQPFNEEYTLVAVADYILSQQPGNTVSNLSSTQALADVTHQHGGQYFAAAVGEVNVVNKMKEVHAIIGGEGNGGIIAPDLHYGRDALAGIALFLTGLAKRGGAVSQWKAALPQYEMYKDKIQLNPEWDVPALLHRMAKKYQPTQEVLTIDGVKILFEDRWVHLRPSNTEPIIRVYTEAPTADAAEQLAKRFSKELMEFIEG